MCITKDILNRIREAKEKQLKKLDLTDCRLTEIPREVFELEQIELLYLNSNLLRTVPKSITKLSNLTELNLSFNQITTVLESITKLSNLIKLDLWKNQITTVPESITKLSNLTELDLRYNLLETPPIEIAEQGIEAIRDYFQQLKEEGKDYIYEAKLLIVGEAGAGKTTLAKKIENPDYQLRDEKSTAGIDVIQWQFPMENDREFRVNIWDLGGQEVYHTTHQFFLTKRSLYILVADTRKEDTDFYYWLNVVQLLSDNSPLLIIKNEKQNRQRQINNRALRGEFTNLKEIIATDLSTNQGLEDIIRQIKHHIRSLPHIGETLPKNWVKVRQALENDDRDYMSLQEYLDICEANGFTEPEYKLQLSGYLHDLGICLHFRDKVDSLLYKIIILNPEWATEGVYRLLDNPKVINNQGCFNNEDLKNIWSEDKYALMRGELLELMKNFQLCYEITERKGTFIAPQLLSHNQPEYDWDQSQNLILRYKYPDFMPKGIISRFIVRIHQYIEEQKYVWKSGVILNKDKTKAEVIEDYNKREIKIRIAGRSKRELLNIVSYELDKIHQSYNRLNYQKLIPCNCEDCQDNQSPYSFSYETLLNCLEARQQEIQCLKSFQNVNILSLIDNVLDLESLIEGAEIEKDQKKELRQRIISAIRAGSISAISSMEDSPLFSFFIGALEDFQQTK